MEAHEELSRASLSRRDSLRSIASLFSKRSIQADQEPPSHMASSIQGDSSKFDFHSPEKGTKPNQVAPGKRVSAFGQAKLAEHGNKSPSSGGQSDEGSSSLEVDHPPKAPVENKIELAQSQPQEAPVENKIELAQSPNDENNLGQVSD